MTKTAAKSRGRPPQRARRARPNPDSELERVLDACHASAASSGMFLLWRAALRGRELMEMRIAPLGLRARHLGVLWILEQTGRISQQQIAALLGLDPSTIVLVLDEMEKKDLVRRVRNPRDRRAYGLVATAKGRQLAHSGAALMADLDQHLLAPLERGERGQLLQLLARLAAPRA